MGKEIKGNNPFQSQPSQPDQQSYAQQPPPPSGTVSNQSTQPQAGKACPSCKSPMRYIQQYDSWYCDNCQKYE